MHCGLEGLAARDLFYRPWETITIWLNLARVSLSALSRRAAACPRIVWSGGMTQDELMKMLRAHEWRDVEFKEAQRAVPRSAYETVSAFANTDGGHLVFGVRQSGQDMEVVGVLDVDKVQNEFLTTLRQPDKISVVVNVREELHKHDGADLLTFHVPEVHRSEKPVFLNGDIRRAFVRSGGSNIRCSDNERNRFLIDAAAERYDGQAVDLNLSTAFDPESIRWYRAVYEGRPGNRSYASLSDMDFLNEMGLLVERKDGARPTRGAVLLFGANPAFRQLLPRPVVDCQRFAESREAADTGRRWFDRLIFEENLIRTWRSLIDDWYGKFAEHPFRVDPATLQRDDTPPDYLAFRESMVNLVIHQDYSDHSRHAVIRQYADRTVFWNPGDVFAAGADLLEPGEKEVRNPRIVLAFRRIGLNENAGWGLRDVFRSWQQLGYVPPRIAGDKRRKSFELLLQKEKLLSERQLALQNSLGVRLTDEQARAFAFACRENDVTLSQIKAVTGLPGPAAATAADRLTAHTLLERAGPDRYVLAKHLRERIARSDRVEAPANLSGDQVRDQVRDQARDQVRNRAGNQGTVQVTETIDRAVDRARDRDQAGDQVRDQARDQARDQVEVSAGLSAAQVEMLSGLSPIQRRIVELCAAPLRLTEIMAALGAVNRVYFKKRRLDPLIQAGIVRMTNPDTPRDPDQRYVLTSAGAAFMAASSGKSGRSESRGQE